MKKYLALAMFVVLAVALISPVSVSAKTKAGVKSGSFFYFFDKAFEKADLFFTFNPEKKAKKALENAEERLAEAEESASENKPEAAAEAMKDYQKNIEVLEKVLNKVPEQAKEAITKAIEADKERREEMTKKIEEINNEIKKEDNDFKKNENEKLKSNDNAGDNESGKEEVENENKDENKKDEQKKEIEKSKKEVETLKQKQPQVKIIEKIEKPVFVESKQSSSSQTNNQTKQSENIVTLPNGAVVEMDEKGNVVKTIKEAFKQSYVLPVPVNKTDGNKIPSSSSSQSIITINEAVPIEISIQNQICNLSQTNFKTEYQLYDLLQNGNNDGRIFMNAYILNSFGENYYNSNPSAIMTITTSNHSNNKTLNGSGNTGPCGYYYPYEFYTTEKGVYTINYSVPEFNLSKTVTLNIMGAEKPAIGSSGITISTSQKETDYPLSELANLDSTSNVKYWFQTSKPNYRYSISAWCSDTDTPSSKIDLVSHLGQDGLYYYRGYFSSSDKFSGITTCKFIHSADTTVSSSSESDIVTFDVK